MVALDTLLSPVSSFLSQDVRCRVGKYIPGIIFADKITLYRIGNLLAAL